MSQKSVYRTSQENIVATSETQVCFTGDYRMFRYDPRNRPVIPEHVDELVSSIKRKNLLHLFPIIIDTNFVVIDGQHRLEAAKALGIPIYYIVSCQITIADVPMITAVIRKWQSEQYMDHYCAQGVSDYLAVRELWRKYSFLRLNQVMQLSHSGDVKNIHPTWRNGTYKANSIPFCIKVAEAALVFRRWEHINFYSHVSFIGALSNLLSNKLYLHDRLMRKMEYLSRRLVKCADADGYIDCINEIYNHKVEERNRVDLKKLGSASKEFDRNRWN